MSSYNLLSFLDLLNILSENNSFDSIFPRNLKKGKKKVKL